MGIEGKSTDEIEALATLTDSVMSNPKTRLQFQRLLKASNPNISVPEIDLADSVSAAVKPHVDEMARMRQEQEQRTQVETAERAANALYEALRDKGAVNNRDGFNKLVKYATDHGFMPNEQGLLLAASHQASELESAEPTPMPGAVDLSKHEQHKDLLKNPQAWARSAAESALDELNGRRPRA